MQTMMRALALSALVVVATAARADAQQAPATIPFGKWTGRVTPPGEPELAVSFDVANQNDTVTITINAGGHGSFKAEGVKIEPARIVFSFTPGPVVLCVLNKKEDASYAGECTEDDGTAAQMVMIPPQKEG